MNLTHDEKSSLAVTFASIEMNTWDGRRGDKWILARLAESKAAWPGEYARALSEQRIRRRNPMWGREIE